MPIVTTAVIAVTAAIATTTLATVATAAVAVGTLVGTMGLAVGVVGMATGNKDLMKAGQIMGYVGLAGGLAGLGAGALASAAESTASSLIAPSVQQSVTAGIEQAGKVGAGTVLAPAAAPAVGAGTVLAPAATTGAGTAAANLSAAPAADVVAPAAQPSPIATASQNGTTAAGNPIATPEVNTAIASQAPVTSMAGTAAPTAPVVANDALAVTTNAASQAPGLVGAATGPAAGTSDVKNAWDKLPDWVKAQTVTTGAQTLAGFAGGWFQGLSAEQRLELDQLINNQRQNQVNYLNKNNAYSPRLSFGSTPKPTPTPGLIGAAGKA